MCCKVIEKYDASFMLRALISVAIVSFNTMVGSDGRIKGETIREDAYALVFQSGQ